MRIYFACRSVAQRTLSRLRNLNLSLNRCLFSFPQNFFPTHTADIVILSTCQYLLYGKRCPPALWRNRNSLQTILAGKQQPDIIDDTTYLESMPSIETRSSLAPSDNCGLSIMTSKNIVGGQDAKLGQVTLSMER